MKKTSSRFRSLFCAMLVVVMIFSLAIPAIGATERTINLSAQEAEMLQNFTREDLLEEWRERNAREQELRQALQIEGRALDADTPIFAVVDLFADPDTFWSLRPHGRPLQIGDMFLSGQSEDSLVLIVIENIINTTYDEHGNVIKTTNLNYDPRKTNDTTQANGFGVQPLNTFTGIATTSVWASFPPNWNPGRAGTLELRATASGGRITSSGLVALSLDNRLRFQRSRSVANNTFHAWSYSIAAPVDVIQRGSGTASFHGSGFFMDLW